MSSTRWAKRLILFGFCRLLGASTLQPSTCFLLPIPIFSTNVGHGIHSSAVEKKLYCLVLRSRCHFPPNKDRSRFYLHTKSLPLPFNNLSAPSEGPRLLASKCVVPHKVPSMIKIAHDPSLATRQAARRPQGPFYRRLPVRPEGGRSCG